MFLRVLRVPRGGEVFLQPPQIISRRIEAVDVIDPEPGGAAAADELEGEPMHFVEHGGVFHAQRRELVDVEKPAVVDFL